MKKPQYMYLKDVKKSSSVFDATHKVAVYGESETSNDLPKWFKKFHEEEFKPLRDAFIKSQTQTPVWFIKFYKDEFKPFQEQILRLQTELSKRFEEFAEKVLTRLDNLVSKNNLKE